MKGLRSAHDLVDSSAAAADAVADDGFVVIVSNLVAASFALVEEVLLRRMDMGDRPIC